MIALKLLYWVLRLETAHAEGRRPFVFLFLNEQRRGREQFDIADVVRVRVRDREIFDVGRFDTEGIKLTRQRLWSPPVSSLRISGSLPIRHSCDCIGNAGIPEHPSAAVLDKIAIVDKLHRLALIDAW